MVPVHAMWTSRAQVVVLQGGLTAGPGGPVAARPRVAGVGGPRSPAGGPAGARPAGGAASGPARAPAGRFPAARGGLQRARAFALLFLEVEAGLRPRRQLIPLMAPRAFEALAPVWVRRGPARQLRQLALFAPDRGAVAAVALASTPRGRPAAVAFALRNGATGWLVTHAWRPEDGPLDLLAAHDQEEEGDDNEDW